MDQLFVNSHLLQALDALRLNLSHYYLLLLAYENRFEKCSEPHVQGLERKGFLKGGALTTEGRHLYEQLANELKKGPDLSDLAATVTGIKKVLKENKVIKSEHFDKWWKTYPAGTTFIDEASGRRFHGGRSLRVQKAKCEKMYVECLEGGADPEKMLAALEYDISERKKKSLATGKNHLDYLQASATYLYQRTFEAVIEMMELDYRQQESSKKNREPIDTKHLF